MRAVKLLLLIGAAAMMSGCRFWYKPVPVANAVGKEKTVLAGDTVNVHRDERFEVYGPSAEAVYDGYEQLNRAYRAFERHFDTKGPKLAVILAADSSRALDPATATSLRERGFTVLWYERPRTYKSPTRYGALGYGGVVWPVAPTAARAMLARYVDSQLESDGQRSDSVLLDRLPLWYRAAVMHLVGEVGTPSNDTEYLRERRAQMFPLRHLLTLVRPSAADTMLDPSRRNDADDQTRIIAAQASTFARFLSHREGQPVLGKVGRSYLAGRSLNEIVGAFKSVPRNIPELERRWRAWIETNEQ
jgi:hypothetical protein